MAATVPLMDGRQQAVTGIVAPQTAEAKIRETWPSVARVPGLASLGRILTRSIVLAPVAWLLMSLLYFGKLLPVFARRYTLTNRRLMVRTGWSGKVAHEVSLADIDEVRIQTDANSTFFRAATLEILAHGHVVLTLPGTPEADSWRHAILNACNAWVPGRASRTVPFVPASAK